MLKINIVKELNKIAYKNIEASERSMEAALNSVKDNLAMEDAKDAAMLSAFGTHKVIIESAQQKENLEKRKHASTLLLEDIKKVCLKYNLRFLSAKHYKKDIPLRVLNDLLKFSENTHGFNKNKLYVIAPYTHFKLGKKPKSDPVLLYLSDWEMSEYKIVSTWGSDFTIFRRLLGAYRNFPNLINWALCVFNCAVGFCYYRHSDISDVFLIVAVISSTIYPISLWGETDGDKSNYNKSIRDVWRLPYK